MNITILFGGKSGEHEVSVVSASYVARNIDTKKHTVNLIGIAKDGKWYYQDLAEFQRVKNDPESSFQIKTDYPVFIIPGGGKNQALQVKTHSAFESIHTDIVFPVLHGSYGEDGTIQGLLEMAELPYVGCGTMASALTMDKEKTKQIWEFSGLPVVPYICAKKDRLSDIESLICDSEKKFGYPVFIKPCCAGSSVGSSKASDKKELYTAVEEAFKWDEKILIEKFIPAREIECSVTGNYETKSYTLGEISPTHEFYDYDAKYKDPNGASLLIPAKLDKDVTEKIKNMAEKAYTLLDVTGLSRVDFFICKETGQIMLNEINTMPGFTSISMFPKMCEVSGLKYADLIEHLIKLGIERFEYRRNLKTSR
ncbi:MAG: D-alanine--D-alanine ligase family protein [Treponemataceae bacterium]